MRFYQSTITENKNTENKNTENNNTENKNTENKNTKHKNTEHKNTESIDRYTCLGAQWNTGINALFHVPTGTIATWGGGVIFKWESVEIFYEREYCAGCH